MRAKLSTPPPLLGKHQPIQVRMATIWGQGLGCVTDTGFNLHGKFLATRTATQSK